MSTTSNLDAPVTIDGVFAQIRAVMVEREQLRTRNEQLRADVETLAHKLEAAEGDLRRAEHDLARLIRFARGVWTMPELKKFVDEIDERGAPGWLERALSDETAEPVRQERAAWEAHVSEAVQEGERRIDAIDRQHAALAAAIQTAIPAILAGINALGSSEADVRSRNVARDSLHALEAAVEGAEPPAAVLSAAELEVVRGVLDRAETWAGAPWDEHVRGPLLGELVTKVREWRGAGRPLASEGKEG